ncbi:hypothetical protein KIPB_016845, partial [Kipferlia bialata]|eukprot:g16845.t1
MSTFLGDADDGPDTSGKLRVLRVDASAKEGFLTLWVLRETGEMHTMTHRVPQ